MIPSFASPGVEGIAPAQGHVATTGLTLTLFLIGAGLSAQTLRAVGWRPFLQGVLLWLSLASSPWRSLSGLSRHAGMEVCGELMDGSVELKP
jgi:hypothetical protein